MSRVTDTLSKLSAGELTTDEAAAMFTDMDWPSAKQPARDLGDIERHPDPEAMEPGDFGEVESAYVDGAISLEQYEQLVTAAMGTEGVNRTDQPG